MTVAARVSGLRRLRAALAVMLLLGGSASCGYALVGRGSFIPGYIRIVAIPTFVNRTQRFELEARLTDAVTREFVSRGNYRIVGEETGADAMLRGEILSFFVRPLALNRGEEADSWEVEIRARVTFTDLIANKVLFTNSAFQFRDQFEFPGSTDNIVDVEIGAIDEIAVEFARSVVSSILEGF